MCSYYCIWRLAKTVDLIAALQTLVRAFAKQAPAQAVKHKKLLLPEGALYPSLLLELVSCAQGNRYPNQAVSCLLRRGAGQESR